MIETYLPKMNKQIFLQLNRLLIEKSKQAEVINHNLEKGLGNEQILRDLFKSFLPNKYGIAKGKIINYLGDQSKQCDLIIYDYENCPKLFIDENGNQIIPIEGVYGVIQIKTTLNRSTMEQAFENLLSVYKLKDRVNQSTNKMLEICPPDLIILAYHDKRSLDKIAEIYSEFSQKYAVKKSFTSYSKKSPGFKDYNGRNYLVSNVVILDTGTVFHMFDGVVAKGIWREYTLGMSLTDIVVCLSQVKLNTVNLTNYLNVNDFKNETVIQIP
jgi:hypothetical protein